MSTQAHEGGVQGEPPPTIPAEIDRLKERLVELEGKLPELVAAEVEKVAGPLAAEAVKAALAPAAAELEKLTELLAQKAEREGVIADAWAHSKISAVVTAVERAIGIKIPLPGAPGEIVSGEVTVPGAETADQLSK